MLTNDGSTYLIPALRARPAKSLKKKFPMLRIEIYDAESKSKGSSFLIDLSPSVP